MANTVLRPEQIKHLQKFVMTDVLRTILSPRAPRDDVFYWYVGHDPYNSADDHAFMSRLTVPDKDT